MLFSIEADGGRHTLSMLSFMTPFTSATCDLILANLLISSGFSSTYLMCSLSLGLQMASATARQHTSFNAAAWCLALTVGSQIPGWRSRELIPPSHEP